MTAEGINRFTTEFEQVNIKDLTEAQLFANLMEAGATWSDEQRLMVMRAADLAKDIHANDVHREQMYIYHVLRSANRITEYLHITDPDIICAVLLHDTVEHDPDEIIRYGARLSYPDSNEVQIPKDPEEKQLAAFEALASSFTRRTSRIVRGMTNPISDIDKHKDREAWLQEYIEQKSEAIHDPDVFFGEWTDWVDNGLSYIHSSEELPPERRNGYNDKYGRFMPPLEERFYRIDIQGMLDDVAKANIRKSFEVAHERLNVPLNPRPLGQLVINQFESA